MENLEKMISENRELFMDQEPKIGHTDRFEQRLTKQNKRKRNLQISFKISRVAAVGLLMIMSSMWAYNEFIKPEDQIMTLGSVSQEYQEVEFFYTSQIADKYNELQNSTIIDDNLYKESMLQELNHMDSVYTNLQKEMIRNPGDERIVEAMVRHYQTKLKVMTDILNKLKSIQETNNSLTNNPNQYESVEL